MDANSIDEKFQSDKSFPRSIESDCDLFVNLLLQQAGMAGGALPTAFGVYPGVGEAAEVFVGLSLVGSFGVIGADHNRRVGVHADFQILNRQIGRYEPRVFDVGQEL